MENTFTYTAKDNPKDKIDIEIGDSKQLDFYPQQKIMRWDNENNVSIRLIDDENGSEKIETIEDKIKWSKGNKEVYFYGNDKESEFEIILKSKPNSNIIKFTLQDKDVDYWYQPPLTQKEIDTKAIRPENVVGSYAVYAKTQKTNYVSGKGYKTGKMGHIYRPKIIDSVGTEVWGVLHIENGILSVTIPQEFLDNAVYPVRHATGLTFGYLSEGASLYPIENFLAGPVATPASVGELSKVSGYVHYSGSVDFNSKGGIYKTSDSTLAFAITERTGFSLSATWEDYTVTGTVETIEYAICLISNADDGFFYCAYDATGGPGIKYQGIAYGALPDPATFTSDPWSFSIYATYETGGATQHTNHIVMIV